MREDCQAACTRVLWREASVVRTENRGAMWHEEGGMLGGPSTGLDMMRIQKGRKNKKSSYGAGGMPEDADI